jgi:hypothetical protein
MIQVANTLKEVGKTARIILDARLLAVLSGYRAPP